MMMSAPQKRRVRTVLSHLQTVCTEGPPVEPLGKPMTFKRGPPMPNRFMLAPLTNEQSGYLDGVLSDYEFDWLTERAKGGFGCTMTCAAHVQKIGQGFGGQLGTWSDKHMEGLTRLATEIKKYNSVAVCQIHHAGNRTPDDLIGGPEYGFAKDEKPVSPSGVPMTPKHNARALSTAEVEQLVEDFILAAIRCEKAGFDGVELHGAHSYIICQFLSAADNTRTDQYGGSRENRERMCREIIAGIRKRCRPDFNLGLRLSPENFGVKLGDQLKFVQELCDEGNLDYIDLSLWDCFKEPVEKEFAGHNLMWWFNQIDRKDTRIGGAGKIMSSEECAACLEQGMDFVIIGRAGILHHDYPKKVMADPNFEPTPVPASEKHLLAEKLSPPFVKYMGRSFKGFVEAPGVEARPRKSSYVALRKSVPAPPTA